MMELKTEKKTESPTYSRTKPVHDSVGYQHKTETDFVGSGYHPPESFVPLLTKFSHPSNATQKAQILFQLQRHYGNRYVQRVVAAYRAENVEEDESKLASEILSKKGSGRPLDPEVKMFMEQRFGYDFSKVGIHTDSFAARTAQDLGAEAFTIGRDVFFGAGRYNRGSLEGKRLIAHELTHVVQQEGGTKAKNNFVGQAGDAFEKEAVFVGQAVVQGQEVSHRAALSVPAIQLEKPKEKGAPAEKGETPEEAKGKVPIRVKITQIKYDASTEFKYASYNNSCMSSQVAGEYLKAAKALQGKIIPREIVIEREEIEGRAADVKKALKAAAEDLKKAVDGITARARGAKFGLNKPTVKPIEGRIVFKVEALPKDARIPVKISYDVIKWHSTKSFGNDLGMISPTSATIGTEFCTIILTGNLGIGKLKVSAPDFGIEETAEFEIKGLTEEMLSKEILRQYNQQKARINGALQDLDRANAILDATTAVIGTIPEVGSIINAIINVPKAVGGLAVKELLASEKEAAIKQAKHNLIKLEGLPEEAHSETGAYEVLDKEEKALMIEAGG